MSVEQQETWWITGASSGIGYALALAMAEAGKFVIASARSEPALAELAARHPRITALPVDVTDMASIQQAVATLERDHGPIYGAVLNAGIYEPMPSTEFSYDSVARTFDVNVLGLARGLDVLIPKLTAQGRGHIVLMASLAGWRGLPKAVAYGASKAAVAYMGEVLKLELEMKNIKVQIVHPGFVDTPATKVNTFKMPFLMTAQQAAEHIVRGMATSKLNIAFPLPFVSIFRVLQRLPDRWYAPLIRRVTKVERDNDQ